MKSAFAALILVLAFAVVAGAEESEALIVGRVLTMAEQALVQAKVPVEDYRLGTLERQWRLGESHWRLTYKHASLLPTASDDIVGAGGEIFVDVDLHSTEIQIRYGE